MKYILLLIVLVVLLVGCGPARDSDPPVDTTGWEKVDTYFYRAIDYEAQVVCYALYRYKGIDCLPLSDTALPGE